MHNPRFPNPTTSQSKNAKASPIKEFQTIQQANPKMPNLAQSKNPKPDNK
jgi:hypothetical protein